MKDGMMLIIVTEGDVEAVVGFWSAFERHAFAEGFARGASAYGAGGAYGVNWEDRAAELDDAQLRRAEHLAQTPESFASYRGNG